MKPHRTITFLFCPVCGRDDGLRYFGRKHFAYGVLCKGVPITITYRLVGKK